MLARFSARGAGAEKLINAAYKRGVRLRLIRRQKDRSLTGYCRKSDAAALEAIAGETGFALEWRGGDAVFRAAAYLRFRPGLIVGAAILPLLVGFLMSFLWQVRVTNAAQYVGEVRLFLMENGVRPGRRLSELSAADLQAALEHRLPAVKWARVTLRGVVMTVDLTPGTNRKDEAEDGDLVAAEGGLIVRVACFAGTPLVKPGEVVVPGQTLIQGRERGADGETVPVRARGEAIARVWTQARATVRLTETLSVETGREYERLLVETPFFSYAKAAPPDYLTSDVTRERTALGAFLPVYAVRETYRELALEYVPRDEAQCRREAAEIAEFLLLRALRADDEVVDKWVDYSMIGGGSITATATAETLRDVALPNIP